MLYRSNSLLPPPLILLRNGKTVTIYSLLIVTRAIHFASVFSLFGASLFWFYAFPKSAAGPLDSPKSFAATRWLIAIAALLAALTGALWLAEILLNMTSSEATPDWAALADFENWRLFFFETLFGPVAILRLFLLALLMGIVSAKWRGLTSLRGVTGVSLLLIVSQAGLGHAAEGGATWRGAAMIAAYTLHTLAGAAWVGGLLPLLFTLREHIRPNFLAKDLASLHRFSAMGMGAVSVIVLSGIVNAGFRVGGSYGELFNTPYGNILFTKLGFVAVMIVLAAINRFVEIPKLRSTAGFDAKRDNELKRSIFAEFLLGLTVIGVAATLGITPPPQ